MHGSSLADAPSTPRVLSLALGDRLFGGTEPVPGPSRRWLLRYLGVAALLASIIVARRPDAVTNPQFWAEDSVIYFWENLRLGFWGALANFYNDYPMLVQRLIAGAGGLVPLANAPLLYTSSTIAITAFALATFALPGFRHLVRSDALRVLWCVAVVSLRVDVEMLSTPTNLGWYLAIWLALLSVMRTPRTWWCIAALSAAAAVPVLTNPLALITGPIWLLRAWNATVRRHWRELGLSLAQLGLLIWALLLTRDFGARADTVYWPGGVTSSILSDRIGVLRGWLELVADGASALVLPPAALSVVRATRHGTAGLAAVIAGAALGACWRGRFATLPAVLLATYYAAGSLLLMILGRPALLFLRPGIPARYTIFPAAMFVLGLMAAADALSGRCTRTIAVGTLSVVFAWAWWPAFVVPPFIDQDWPTWAARLEGKLALQTHERLDIPMNPRWSPLRIDVRTMSTEISVPPSVIVAALGSHGKFWQTFISRCEGLSEVDFWLDTMAPTTQGDVLLTVFDLATRTAAVSVRLPRAELTGFGWQPFYFAPVAGSAGTSYLVQLEAVDNDPDATILVMGSRGDPYPDGGAFFLGKRIEADAAIRYGCTVPSTALPLAPGSPAIPLGPRAEHAIGRY